MEFIISNKKLGREDLEEIASKRCDHIIITDYCDCD